MKKIVPKPVAAPTLVLMAGLPGVGKSTLASRLGLDLGWVVIDRDSFKDSLLEDALLKERIAEDTAGWASYEVFFRNAHDLLVNQHQSIILDTSTLHRFIFERTRDLASAAGAEFKVILCEVDEKTRQHRLRTRKKRVSQVHDHLVPEEAARQFDEFLPGHTLIIDTKDPLKKYEEKALAYIAGPDLMVSSVASTKVDAFHESPIPRREHFKFFSTRSS
ncbi:MAG: AAA family ATPase [Ktedonobacteraceae bacterium]